uniref:Uncharacterized protein n=1 Tax=viral metagenome TaxID=1070528 RepID=A0A6H1ZPD2_9ZZZZ
MQIVTKQGVWIAVVNDWFLWFCKCLDEVWERWGNTPTITSAADGKHMEGSFHYINQAWDLRVWGLRDPAAMAKDLKEKLEEDGNEWRVLFGDEWHRDHMHVEVHPK